MARYRPNHREFAKFMNSDGPQDAAKTLAEHGADDLRRRATHHPGEDQSPHYVQSIRVDVGHVGRFRGSEARAAAFLVADVEYASLLEVGSKRIKNPPRWMTQTLNYLRSLDPNRH